MIKKSIILIKIHFPNIQEIFISVFKFVILRQSQHLDDSGIMFNQCVRELLNI